MKKLIVISIGIYMLCSSVSFAAVECQIKSENDINNTNPCPKKTKDRFYKTTNRSDIVKEDQQSESARMKNNSVRSTATSYDAPSEATKAYSSGGRSGSYKR